MMSMRTRPGTLPGLILLALTLTALYPTDALSQRWRDAGRAQRTSVTVGAFIGFANYGRFLEQDAEADGLLGERELTARNAVALGATVEWYPWDRTGLRLGYTFSPTDLEYRDDSGTGSERLDRDGLADLNVHVLNVDVLRFLLDSRRRFSPYALAGVSGAWWSLGDEGAAGEIESNGDDTRFRLGGVGGIGFHYSVTPEIAARFEVATFGIGNPFDGEESFTTATGQTFDEPSSARLTRVTLMITYSFLRRR